ncbi:LCP family glycopolymer transferase [Yinghuangia aomiensis]
MPLPRRAIRGDRRRIRWRRRLPHRRDNDAGTPRGDLLRSGWIYYKLNKDINTFSDDEIARTGRRTRRRVQNILILGSDSRSGDNSDFAGGSAENVGGSDTTLLMHVYADHKHAVAVSIPRDTLVTVPSMPPARRNVDQAQTTSRSTRRSRWGRSRTATRPAPREVRSRRSPGHASTTRSW